MEPTYHKETVIIKEKSDGGFLKIAAIVAIVMTSPFWLILGIVIIGCLTSIALNGGVWPWIALLVVSLIPPIRQRIAGSPDTKKLEMRIAQLEREADEARRQAAEATDNLLHLKDTIDFDRKLQESGSQLKLKLKDTESTKSS